ncbi:MAG: hypothetical protein QM775_08775 [Pirellulales bacterium]
MMQLDDDAGPRLYAVGIFDDVVVTGIIADLHQGSRIVRFYERRDMAFGVRVVAQIVRIVRPIDVGRRFVIRQPNFIDVVLHSFIRNGNGQRVGIRAESRSAAVEGSIDARVAVAAARAVPKSERQRRNSAAVLMRDEANPRHTAVIQQCG